MITEVTVNGQTISNITHDDLKEPIDVAVDADGNIYVADIGVGSVLVLEPSGKLMRNIGSPGTEKGHFKDISSVTIAPNGDIIVADSRIQVFILLRVF
jgi:tripartite motif-containing protein 2/3